MARRKKTVDDYILPDGVTWFEGEICVGGNPANPTLMDIQDQITEKNNAAAEGRDTNVLAIRCGFCQNFHKDAQLKPEQLIGGEVGPYDVVTPDEPEGSPYLIAEAANALINPDNYVEPDATLEDLLNDDNTSVSGTTS